MLRTLTLAYIGAIILSFISKAIAFLFSPEEGDTDEYFVDTRGYKNTTHDIENTLAAQHTVASRLFTLVIVWQLTASAQNLQSITQHIAR